MPNEEPRLPKYSFLFTGDYFNSYLFSTHQDATYEVKFKPSGYLIGDEPQLGQYVFELIISVIEKPVGQRLRTDSLIPSTIVSILDDFFKTHERVVVYIADDSDSKTKARQRKFDGWYTQFGGADYLKNDIPLVAKDGIVYAISMISRWDNPYQLRIYEALLRLAAKYREPK